MASNGIKDKVAIISIGCTPFKEHWDKSADDLLIDATTQTLQAVDMNTEDIDAYWVGTAQSGMSGLTLSMPMKLHGKPVTRVENYCATGSEALRQACYAVASGAYDTAMAVGVEKVKDSGYQGLNAFPMPTAGTNRTLTAAAMYSLVLPAYAKKYGIDQDELRMVVAKIAEKNHFNGARNELAQFRREISAEEICNMAAVAGKLSVFDCAGVADGAAAVIVVPAEKAYEYTDKPLFVKALSFVSGNGSGLIDPEYDYTTFPECEAAATVAGLIGHSLMNWSLVRIPLWVGSILTLFVPVVSSLLAWIFLEESLNTLQIFSTCVVILALGAILLGQGTSKEPV